MPSQEQTPLSPSETQNSVPTLFDFIYLVPSPVTIELVALSPYISCIRHAAEIASWKSSWSESWLVLAAWWAVCLFAYPALKYFLPLLIVLAVAFSQRRSSLRLTPLVTEQNLQAAVYDLSTMRSLIPNLPPTPTTPLPILARIIAITYVPYLALTYFVRIRVLLGIAGTILITWRAPWAITIRHTLWRSAYIRWGIYHLSSRLTGQPLPPPTLSMQSTPTPITSIRFLFTIYENQRWWMGLDWTAALLPAERPSWCTASQTAVSPPNAFSLPEPAVAFLEDGKGGRVKRTATWSWEEGEWKVLVRKDDVAGMTRVERPLPDEKESPPASRILKAVVKKRDSFGASSEKIAMTEQTPEVSFQSEEEEIVTDPDGWIYGDNKWEGASAKGGLGKYTRHRRWTRVAVLSETIETVDAGEVGVTRPTQDSNLKDVAPLSTSSLVLSPSNEAAPPGGSLPQESPKDGSRGLLRQRLKAAVDGSAL